MSSVLSSIPDRLSKAPTWAFSLWCIAAAFGTYFCMYAFRKPFTVATFESDDWLNKSILIAAQTCGYALSKFVGIKVISEMPPTRRALAIVLLIAFAEGALCLFAVVPPALKPAAMFLNGLPLGMVFGLVLSFLEGRQITEALAAGLCASFIVASGVVKSVGSYLIVEHNVSEFSMPMLTGGLFALPLLFFVWMLRQIPPPSASDQEHRTIRSPMNGSQRWSFFRRHAAGILCLLLIYTLLTVMRTLRDDFAVEIWRELGVEGKSSVFAWSEFLVMLGVIVINGAAIGIRSNRLALLGSLSLVGIGFLLVLATLAGHWQGMLSPLAFMVLLGMGTYIPYVAFHTTVFERLIATFREPGNIGYLMYLADAAGYLGIGLVLTRNALIGETAYLQLLIGSSLLIAVISLVITIWLITHYRSRTSSDVIKQVAYGES